MAKIRSSFVALSSGSLVMLSLSMLSVYASIYYAWFERL
jgi:hypothetical protein